MKTYSSNLLTSFLSNFCEKHLLDEKIFIVPSYYIGHQIGEAVVKAGQPWINLRFVTLPSLALEIAGMELSLQGLKQISGTASRIIINHIFRELKESQLLKYYGQLEAQSGIIDAIFRSLRDLRAAGIKSENVRPEQFIDRQKGQETILILRKYEEELERGKYFDTAQLYAVASDIAKKSASKAKTYYLYLQDQIFSKVERDFLNSLTDEIILVPYGQVKEMPRPRRLMPKSAEEEVESSPRTDLERSPWLFALVEAPPPLRDGTLQMFQATGPTNECREVIRRIIKERIPFDQVEIIHPSGSIYPSIFYVLSEKSGVHFSSGEGLPLSFTIPGKLFSEIIRWMENNYPAKNFCYILESEYIKTPKEEKETFLSPLKISRILKEAKVGWGKERYVQRINALYETKKEKFKAEDGDAETLKAIKKISSWFRDIVELFPSWEEKERVDIAELCAGISSFLKRYCRIKDDSDGEAVAKITSRLDEVSSFISISFTKNEAIEWLLSVVEQLRFGTSGPVPGFVHLAPFLSGGFSGRPYTFIVGLDQGAVPGSRLPDPILLDEEREAISQELAATADKLRENLYLVTSLLTSLRGKVVLSFSSYDVIEERQVFPSSFLLQVHRLIKGDATLDYSHLAASLGSSTGFIPASSGAIDDSDWWLDRIAGGGQYRDALKSVRTIFPFVSQGDYARNRRNGERLSPYDGIVTLHRGEFHPCYNPELTMSASRFEKMAGCPYSYFLRYVLEIQPPDEIALDKAQWLDAMQRGTLLHDIFCAFMRRLRDRGEIVLAKKHRAEIRSIAEEIIAQYREENPPPSEVVFEREKNEIFLNLDIFLRAEERREITVNPILFEVIFGIKGEKSEGIAESVPFKLEKEKSFLLNGRIDRIDAMEGGCFRVIDYKTGGYTRYEEIKEFGKGMFLQHALYAEAAEEIMRKLKIDPRPRVTLSGYAFPTRRGDGREILIGNFDRARLRLLLAELLSVLESGHFLVNPKANCDYCDYSVVCGSEVLARTIEKKEANAAEFALFERLKEFK